MRPTSLLTVRLLAVSLLLGAGAAEATAGGPGFGPGGGFGRANPVRIGTPRAGATRFGPGRLGRFPGALYGAGFAAPFAVPSAVGQTLDGVPPLPERLETWSWSKSVVIHRGPAFGEPGYVSEPVVLRLLPAGPGRFRVERIRP